MQPHFRGQMDDPAYDQFPALRGRLSQRVDHKVDEARRVLWRAFQHGTLSEEELARTLDRIEFEPRHNARLDGEDHAN
jgi:hypothetical protein